MQHEFCEILSNDVCKCEINIVLLLLLLLLKMEFEPFQGHHKSGQIQFYSTFDRYDSHFHDLANLLMHLRCLKHFKSELYKVFYNDK